MARKSGQPSRSKKSNQTMRAVSKPKPVLGFTTPMVPDNIEPKSSAEPSAPSVATRPVTRPSRPYQQRKASPTARSAAASTFSISKDQEYAFIREDLRRLLVTAGILIAVMIALLLTIDR